MDKQVYTPAELQELLQIGRKQTYELINDGKIHSIRIGKSIRIPAWAFDEYLGIDRVQTIINPRNEKLQTVKSV